MATVDRRIERLKGLVLDFDGTLFDLPVDWTGLKTALSGWLLDVAGVDLGSLSLSSQLDYIAFRLSPGIWKDALALVKRFEMESVRGAAALPLAKWITTLPSGLTKIIYSQNCRETIVEVLSGAGLSKCCDSVLGREQMAASKPDATGLVAELLRLGMNPGLTVFVGDSQVDEQCARNAGCAGFMFPDDAMRRIRPARDSVVICGH